jgi:hypothetical protein
METIELTIPRANWQGLQPTAAQAIAAAAFWDVHGYRPVLHPADMFPHDCARCRARRAEIDARRAENADV